MPKQIVLWVSDEYVTPGWFEKADTLKTELALTLAATIVPLAFRETVALDIRLEQARRDGIDEAVGAAIRAAKMQVATTEREELASAREKMVELAANARANEQRAKAECAELEMKARAEERAMADQKVQEAMCLHEGVTEALKVQMARVSEIEAKLECEQVRCRELETENAHLKTPSGRGVTGEENVADILRSAGYRITDTSNGSAKELYCDLLASVDQEDDDDVLPKTGIRIAIEVKNKNRIDSRDLVAFAQKAKTGIQRGLFEAALFVSLRAYLPGNRPPCRLDVVADENDAPIGCVSYIGSERRMPTAALLAEQVEVQIHCLADMARLTIEARRLAKCDANSDIVQMRDMISAQAAQTSEMLHEFNRHDGLIEELKKSLNTMRTKLIVRHRQMGRSARKVGCLAQLTTLPWERYFEHAIRLQKDGKVDWRNVTNGTNLLNAIGGKDVALKAIMAEQSVDT